MPTIELPPVTVIGSKNGPDPWGAHLEMEGAISRYYACGTNLGCVGDSYRGMIDLGSRLKQQGVPWQDMHGLRANIAQAGFALGRTDEAMNATGAVAISTLAGHTAKTINPNTVRFSQDSAKAAFGKGGSIQEMADALRSGALKPDQVPAIRLVERDGQLFTLDNRRLEAFRRAGVDVPYRMATPEEAARESWKFTTRNDGVSIRIRGE